MQPVINRQKEAFTRLDLIAVLACVSLLLGVVVSRLAAAEPAVDRQVCQKNLGALGQALQAWAKDHGGKLPWMAKPDEGGTHGSPIAGNLWVQLASLSNHLASPKLLACPSDKVKTATEWSRRPEAGFWHQGNRDNAASYFLGLDMTESSPKGLLSGDHNIQVSARAQLCDSAGVRSAVSLEPGNDHVRWLEDVHGDPGNILFNDGSVKSLNSEELRAALAETKARHPENHSLWPR